MGKTKKKQAASRQRAAVSSGSKNSKLVMLICALCALVVLVTLVVTMVILPLQEKHVLQNAGLTVVNGSVELGTYEQDNDGENGPEAIVWRVMKVEDGYVYLVAKEGLDVHPFNLDESKGNAWETSDLKAWLEGEFRTQAGLDQVEGTLTCLSIEDAEKYFDLGADRACTPTAYALEQGAHTLESGAGIWWLRDAGSNAGSVATVGAEGSLLDSGKINQEGIEAATSGILVRPAILITL